MIKPIEIKNTINVNSSLPYQGCKKGIAEPLIQTIHNLIPEKRPFIDLFGGGGSISSVAYQSSFFDTIYYNEIKKNIYELIKHLLTVGITEDFNHFVDRKEFFEKKDFDNYFSGYILTCYGFANSDNSYFCNPEKEIIKHKVHQVIMYDDYNLFDQDEIELINAMKEVSSTIPRKFNKHGFVENFNERRLKIWCSQKTTLKENPIKYFDYGVWYSNKLSEKKGNRLVLSSKEQSRIIREKDYSAITDLRQIGYLEELQRLDQLQQFINMERLSQFEKTKPIWNLSNMSYEEFEIPNNAIVYLDPPYEGTENKYGAFDHTKFEKWAKSLKVPVFLSEYKNILGWKEVYNITKRSSFSSEKLNNQDRVERLYWNQIK